MFDDFPPVPVTDTDRDLFERLSLWFPSERAGIALGKSDRDPRMQALARHRLAQPTPASDDHEGLVERLREALVTLDVFLAGYNSEPDTDVVRNLPDEDLLTWGDLRQIHAVLAALSTPKPATSEVPEAEQTIRDALMDSQYAAGVSAGWNAAQCDDPETAFAQLQASRAGRLGGFKEAKAVLAALAGKGAS